MTQPALNGDWLRLQLDLEAELLQPLDVILRRLLRIQPIEVITAQFLASLSDLTDSSEAVEQTSVCLKLWNRLQSVQATSSRPYSGFHLRAICVV